MVRTAHPTSTKTLNLLALGPAQAFISSYLFIVADFCYIQYTLCSLIKVINSYAYLISGVCCHSYLITIYFIADNYHV